MPDFKYDVEKVAAHRTFISSLDREMSHQSADPKAIRIFTYLLSHPSHKSPVFVYRPRTPPPYPTVLYICGTAYNTSVNYITYVICSQLAKRSGCQVINIPHRLAPEHPCPIGFEDVYYSYKTIIRSADFLQIDLNKIAISGYSSGGNFAALTAIRAKEEKFTFALQILIAPLIDLTRQLKEFKYFEDKDRFSESLTQWFLELYLQNNDPYNSSISPIYAQELANLPATYFLYGEFDRFRGDSEAYANKLTEQGVWTHKTLFKDRQHISFWHDIGFINTMACQLKLSFGLLPIQKLSPLFFSMAHQLSKKEVKDKEKIGSSYLLEEERLPLLRT